MTAQTNQQKPSVIRLDNWRVIQRDNDLYTAPEQRRNYLAGVVTGHHEISDGEPITTSAIVGNSDGKIQTRTGSEYELGDINPDYEKAYPGAGERIFQKPYKTKGRANV